MPINVRQPSVVRGPRVSWEDDADEGARLETRGEGYQWQAKERYETAYSQVGNYRTIAERVGKSFKHIQLLCTMVHRPEAELEGWSFAEAYAKAKQKQPRDHEPVEINPADGFYPTVVIDPPCQ
jgi:hypothetical protein